MTLGSLWGVRGRLALSASWVTGEFEVLCTFNFDPVRPDDVRRESSRDQVPRLLGALKGQVPDVPSRADPRLPRTTYGSKRTVHGRFPERVRVAGTGSGVDGWILETHPIPPRKSSVQCSLRVLLVSSVLTGKFKFFFLSRKVRDFRYLGPEAIQVSSCTQSLILSPTYLSTP